MREAGGWVTHVAGGWVMHGAGGWVMERRAWALV